MNEKKANEKQAELASSQEMVSEVEPTDQLEEEASKIAEAFKGRGAEKSEAPESDDASGAENPAAQQEAEHSDQDRQIADFESKETNSFTTPESNDENLSDDDGIESARDGEETRLSEVDSDQKGEDDKLPNILSDDTSVPAAAKASSHDEQKDSSAEAKNDTENDSTEKDESGQQLNDAEVETDDLSELEPKKKIPLAKAAATVIMVAAVFSGFFIFDNKSSIKSARKTSSKEVGIAVASKASFQDTNATIQPDDPNYIYHAKIKEISELRETLLHKKEEIRQLKKYYQEGIAELEKEIVDEMRDAKIETFLQALENKRIEFGLQTIQRRHAYMRQLDRPLEWIYKACEELLYLKRRAMVDLRVAEVASGIDLSIHMQHMNTAIENYRPTADRLAVDMQDAQLEPLEKVWEQIKTRNLQLSTRHASSKNRVISEQVCSGAFVGVSELSEISVEAAKCIAEMPGSDLFLNDLSEISPRAAKYLFQWKGSWLCLNGFKALSPRVANYLFQWDGGWISLNGLTDFPAELGQILQQWQGKQLELMGLRCTDSSFDNIGIEYLAQWEHAGGKLFVPQEVRKKIDAFKGHSA